MEAMYAESKLGLGFFTQYFILDFIKEKKPDLGQLLKFIELNCSQLFPPTGFSFTIYLHELLKEKFIERNPENDVITLTSKGEYEVNEISSNFQEEIDKFFNSLNLVREI